MNANATAETPENVVKLPVPPKAKPQPRKSRFKILPFNNPSGETVWRVSGVKANGSRIRENFADEKAAQCRQSELQIEFLGQPSETTIRPTKLSDDQLRLAELAIQRLGEDWGRIVDAVDFWARSGAKNIPTESPRINDAVDQYLAWLAVSPFRDTTKKTMRNRMIVFKNSAQNVPVSEVTPEFIEKLLGQKTSASNRDTKRRVYSRFFSWCIERPRRWVIANPCREVEIEEGEKSPPVILSLTDCKALLRAAEKYKLGMLAPYATVCIFGGLRPAEAARLNWEQVNLKDNEIRLDATQVKTGRKTKKGRTVKICPTLHAWLTAHKGKPFYPANWRNEFDAVKDAAGLKTWTPDVLRHTAISHYFRKTGSYGFTAEQFGNSEAVIKAHYQSRVSSEDTKAFYAIMPAKGGAK